MNNFLRVIRLSLRFRWSILAVVVSSIAVALFWCVSIGAVYPFVLILIDGKSLHQWMDESIVEQRKDLDDTTANIAQLEREAGEDGVNSLSSELLVARQDRRSKQWWLACIERLEPSMKRYVPEKPIPTLILLSTLLFLGTVVKTFFLVLNMVFVARISQRTAMQLRNALYKRTLEMDLGAFSKDHSAGLISNFSADINTITAGLTMIFGKSMREPFKMIGCTILAALISWRLLLFSLLICPLPLLLMVLLAKSIKRASRRVLEQTAEFYERLSETFRAIHVVKAFTMEKWERSRFLQATYRLYRRMLRVAFYSALSRGNNEILAAGVISLSLIAGGYLVLDGQLTVFGIPVTDRPMSPELLFLFFGLLAGMSDPARKLADVVPYWQRAAAGADRVYHLLDREPSIRSPSQTKPLPSPPFSIAFEEVKFRYQPEVPLLEKFDLQIFAGETLAIVGPNGCGKSTLVNLIPRFYEPLAGAIRLNGVDLRELQLSDLRDRVGYVTQQAVLFRESVIDNIRYGSPQATRDQAVEAARKAFAHEFIVNSLDDGYETLVGESGGRLSGGQRQRITLARAILRDPDILLLDEATSQVDPESEKLIHHAVKQFIQDRTTILITHRASTLSLVDRILVMEKGQVVDLGTHAELVGRCELYGRLYQSEMKQSA